MAKHLSNKRISRAKRPTLRGYEVPVKIGNDKEPSELKGGLGQDPGKTTNLRFRPQGWDNGLSIEEMP